MKLWKRYKSVFDTNPGFPVSGNIIRKSIASDSTGIGIQELQIKYRAFSKESPKTRLSNLQRPKSIFWHISQKAFGDWPRICALTGVIIPDGGFPIALFRNRIGCSFGGRDSVLNSPPAPISICGRAAGRNIICQRRYPFTGSPGQAGNRPAISSQEVASREYFSDSTLSTHKGIAIALKERRPR